MKIFLGAMALMVAVPAAAQTPAADPHAGHAQHQAMDHGKHKGMSPAGHGDGKHDCKECCDKMKQGAKMECMDKAAEAKPTAQAAADHHGHAH